MKIFDDLKIATISVLLAVALGACDSPGPAETAGKNIDQTVNEAGQNISEAISKVGQSMSDKGNEASVAISDSEITARVKTVILAGSGLETLQISVKTIKGVVTLSGSVDSRAQSNNAGVLATQVSGVSHVNNHLTIKPG